jgi:hypothetical protein
MYWRSKSKLPYSLPFKNGWTPTLSTACMTLRTSSLVRLLVSARAERDIFATFPTNFHGKINFFATFYCFDSYLFVCFLPKAAWWWIEKNGKIMIFKTNSKKIRIFNDQQFFTNIIFILFSPKMSISVWKNMHFWIIFKPHIFRIEIEEKGCEIQIQNIL